MVPTVIVSPDADGFVNDWSEPATGDHYDDINDYEDPGTDHIAALKSAGDDGDVDGFNFESPSFEGDVSSQVKVWVYGWVTQVTSKATATLTIGGETHGPTDLGIGLSSSWTSVTFTPDGDDWTELEATAVKVAFTADCSVDKDYIAIYACYLEFTYPDQGYSHDYMGVPAANIDEVDGVPTTNIDTIKGV